MHEIIVPLRRVSVSHPARPAVETKSCVGQKALRSHFIGLSPPSDSQPTSTRAQLHLLRQAVGLSQYHFSVNKAYGHVVFKGKGKPLWGCAGRTLTSNSLSSVADFARARGWSCLLARGQLPCLCPWVRASENCE